MEKAKDSFEFHIFDLHFLEQRNHVPIRSNAIKPLKNKLRIHSLN